MRKCDVITPSHALAYITDCNLATVSSMAMNKSRRKGEFERQVSIAQTAVDWMDAMGITYEDTRAKEVHVFGSVREWARQYMPEFAINKQGRKQ